MKTTTELKEFAQLAQASYSLLNNTLIYGDAPPYAKTTDALKASPNGAFAEGQARVRGQVSILKARPDPLPFR